MIGKELKKLGRRELVDIIYQLKKNEQEMQEREIARKKQSKRTVLRICFWAGIGLLVAAFTTAPSKSAAPHKKVSTTFIGKSPWGTPCSIRIWKAIGSLTR